MLRIALWIGLGLGLIGWAGCDRDDRTGEGPAEKIGKTIDKGADEAAEAGRKAADKVGEGLSEAGREIQREANEPD